ncbi:hypothetical protein [Hymenobacter sp. BT559]|uniref:hypothetical protein n=1 Tax=Hymenobacter sp. BT559 TaxID=2795729 RepID=UPI0018EA7A64|nr:hypothetical protein [Hymenobacter sp. BT559]MBJ6143987.1 hypothetical protein [Hymenobacter sp. BT559]
MKTSFFWLATSLLSWPLLSAQAQTPTLGEGTAQQLAEALGPDQLLHVRAGADQRNTASLLQNGTGNTATLSQSSLNLPANQAYIVQVGTTNELNLLQQGSANRTNYTQTGNGNQGMLGQYGTANTLEGSVTGNQNVINLTQDGSNNQIRSEVAASNRQYNLSQIGSNNSITQRETTPSAQPGYSIEQRGSNMHITVEQGRGLPGVP